jgi:hypothetical protein
MVVGAYLDPAALVRDCGDRGRMSLCQWGLGEGRCFKLGRRLRRLWAKVGFCVGVFMGFRGLAGWMAGHVGSMGQLGGDLVQILPTSMEVNIF